MKLYILFISLFYLIVSYNAINVNASLKDFKDNSKSERSSNKRSSSSSSSSGDNCVSEICSQICAEMCSNMITGMCASIFSSSDNNESNYKSGSSCEYHSKKSKKQENVDNSNPKKYSDKKENEDSLYVKNDSNKPPYKVLLGTGYRYVIDAGNAFTANMEYRFSKHIGIEADLEKIWDKKDELIVNDLSLLLYLPKSSFSSNLMHTLYINIGGWIGNFNDEKGNKNKYGLLGPGLGYKLNGSISNFIFEMKTGLKFFDGITFLDFRGIVGFKYKIIDFYLGGRIYTSKTANLNGPLAGIRIRF